MLGQDGVRAAGAAWGAWWGHGGGMVGAPCHCSWSHGRVMQVFDPMLPCFLLPGTVPAAAHVPRWVQAAFLDALNVFCKADCAGHSLPLAMQPQGWPEAQL